MDPSTNGPYDYWTLVLVASGLVDPSTRGIQDQWSRPTIYICISAQTFESANVVDEEIHEAEFVGEADEDVEAGRVEGDGVSLLRELLVQLQAARLEVPDADGTIERTRRDQRLPNANVETCERPTAREDAGGGGGGGGSRRRRK